ncbi:MAG TPA: ABC transporter ATP-binding protein [Acidimicrobiales bacterium]|nr:ABC transporter ATP-binding protein [Acidimicrobiales bacterium]
MTTFNGRFVEDSAITYRGVGFAYPDGEPVIAGVDLDVRAGEILLVAGPSGSGKSTLLRCANGLVPHASGGRFRGDVIAFGRSTRTHPPRRLADMVGFVHQHPESQFVVDQVEADIAFVLENLGMAPVAMRRRVEEVLDALGIAHLRDRSPATLSGGEQQRCAIAGALAAAPSALVLDEPTSQLDPQGAEDVLGAVARLNSDLGTTVFMAEHRLERAGPLAHRALLLSARRDVLATGPASPSGPSFGTSGDATHTTMARRGRPAVEVVPAYAGAPLVPVPGPVGEVLAGYAGAPAVTRLGRLLGWDPPPLTVRQARDFARVSPPDLLVPVVPAGVAPGEVLLSARGIQAVRGGRVILRDLDVEVRQGEVIALLGRNGSGKTTLLRTLAGLAAPSKGEVRRPGTVAYVPQDPDALLLGPTARADVETTCRLLGIRHSDRRTSRFRRQDPPTSDGSCRQNHGAAHHGCQCVEKWLEALDLTHLADRHPRDLSAGERQRLAISAIAVGDPDVLLLDEPTRGMDAPSRAALERLLEDRASSASGAAAVLATHDVELAARCATRVVVLGDGDVVADGPARDVLTGSLFAPQVLRVLPPFLTVEEVAAALGRSRAVPT